ncbi:zf-HC2 domain-containing protein [Actinomadura macra]|uniref:zf-HC2 domain-containing protein n=1 Tax=Actinomadura macra TaxID=46164 RepID=UPI00083691F0|nr:zf-HC2 domain-containing protein [Actinomadura macra]
MGLTNCGAYRLGLGVYALGRLVGAEADALSTHLAGCPRCRAELAELRGVADVLARTLPARRGAGRGPRTGARATRLSGVCAYGATGRGRSR